MAVLGEYHAAIGALVLEHEGTLERFTGDGIMVFFNDPVPVADPSPRAVRMALRCSGRSAARRGWKRRGHDLAWASASPRASRRSAASAFRGASTTARSAPSPTSRRGSAARRAAARSCLAAGARAARRGRFAWSRRRAGAEGLPSSGGGLPCPGLSDRDASIAGLRRRQHRSRARRPKGRRAMPERMPRSRRHGSRRRRSRPSHRRRARSRAAPWRAGRPPGRPRC